MSPAPDPIEALLAQARSEYAASAAAKAAQVEAFVAEGAWGEARRAAHKLRGSAATYGFAALGEAAGRIEDLLLRAASEPGGPDGERERLRTLVLELTDFARVVRVAGGAG
jgi:HPt (histidine-containing phosphotransfer) domain-containing protein